MSQHLFAFILTCLIRTGDDKVGDIEYKAHDAIASMTDGWSDHKRADLYARLAEGLDPHADFRDMEKTVLRCVQRNDSECWA